VNLPPGKPAWLSVSKREGGTLALHPKAAFGFASATNSELLPQPKPRALREHFVMPSIRSRDVACAEWSNVRRCEDALQSLDFSNGPARRSLMAETSQWHSRSHPKYPSPPGARLPSTPVCPLDNAQHSCNPWPPIHGRRIRWRVNAGSCSR
jgi:hypothetical protein